MRRPYILIFSTKGPRSYYCESREMFRIEALLAAMIAALLELGVYLLGEPILTLLTLIVVVPMVIIILATRWHFGRRNARRYLEAGHL